MTIIKSPLWHSLYRVLVLGSICAGCALSPSSSNAAPPEQCLVEIVNLTTMNLRVSYSVGTRQTPVGLLMPDAGSTIGVACDVTVSVYAVSNTVSYRGGLVTVRATAKPEQGKSVRAVLRSG